MSVAPLGPGPGSVVPGAPETDAWLTRFPTALDLRVAMSVYVAVPPTGTFTVSLMFPATGPAVHVAPPAPTQVHDALATWGKDRTLSVTVAPRASAGPAFDTTIVYDTVPPGVYVETPSVLVIARSETRAPAASVSVAEFAPGPGSVVPAGGAIEAVFDRLPAAFDRRVAVSVYVASPPTGMLIVSLRFPATGPAVQVAPPAATQVQTALATWAAERTGSVTVAPTTSLGPGFVTSIVYVTEVPAT